MLLLFGMYDFVTNYCQHHHIFYYYFFIFYIYLAFDFFRFCVVIPGFHRRHNAQ